MIKSRIAVAGALLAVAGAANAQFSVTPTITTDYDFRGATQTMGDAAFQLGATYAMDSGFYLGAWGSNVDYGPGDPNIELDFFAGYAGETETMGYDFGANYYTYMDAGSLNTVELYAGISKDWLSAKLWYSPDYASSDEDGFYAEANAAYELESGFSLLAHVGRTFGDGTGSYYKAFDYSVGVGYSFSNLNLAVKYVDNDEDFSGDKRGAVIASISTTLPWSE